MRKKRARQEADFVSGEQQNSCGGMKKNETQNDMGGGDGIEEGGSGGEAKPAGVFSTSFHDILNVMAKAVASRHIFKPW